MANYDKIPTRYEILVDYGGSSNVLQYIKGPKGKDGLLYDYGCHSVTEAFNGGTLMPQIAVGTATDADAFGEEFDFGALAVTSGGKSIRTTYTPAVDPGWDTYMVQRNIPKDTVVMVTHYAATGSGLTGIAVGFVDIIWAD